MTSPTFRRKRLRLSTDTTHTLPEYNPAAWQRSEDVPLDRPPDYPDSAEEADADTEDLESDEEPRPLLLPLSPQRRALRRTNSHRKNSQAGTSPDAYLDTLLARSVHALEISNALLQSSMTTETGQTSILSSDVPASDRTQELPSKKGMDDVLDDWADELREMGHGVDEFLEGREARMGHSRESSMSTSLPTSSELARRQPRRNPSPEARRSRSKDAPHLRLSSSDRDRFVSPAPKAMTVYIESTDDPNEISLPSTLGLRATGSHWRTPEGTSSSEAGPSRSHPASLHGSGSSRGSAYTILSSFKPRATHEHPPRFPIRTRSLTSLSPRKWGRPDSPASEQSSRGRSSTPRAEFSPTFHREITTCIEESEESPSSSPDSPCARQTIQSLRKILNEQSAMAESARPPESSTAARVAQLRKPPGLFVSPPVPSSGTSTATASISRLFTKATHSSSTRPRSPPRQSSMKRRSVAGTPDVPTPRNASTPDLTGVRAGGRSPKRISFAELPEPRAESRRLRKAGKGSRNGRGKAEEEGGEDKGWLWTWLLNVAIPPGPHASSVLSSRTRTEGGAFDESPII